MEQIKRYITDHKEELLELLRHLCHIPAPSHHEEQRAAFCQDWLQAQGAEGVYTDGAMNVIFPLHCEGSNNITVFVAHTDTVFPDTKPMPFFEDEEEIRCPGAGDDTASLAVLLMTAKFFIQHHIKPQNGILFVANSGEEGLGNLKGTRALFQSYEGRIAQFISFDSSIHAIANRCVGSHRYEVEVRTAGGHSWGAFGTPNAIAALCAIVQEIYTTPLPVKEHCKVTYNVGDISGGTSVNTIAQSARMLCEYRSDDEELLAHMQAVFARIFERANSDDVQVFVTKIGDRPCGIVDTPAIRTLCRTCEDVIRSVTGEGVAYKSSSTDCNIPLSLGIPAICIGVYEGGGAHTREEWVRKASLAPGLEIAIRVALSFA